MFRAENCPDTTVRGLPLPARSSSKGRGGRLSVRTRAWFLRPSVLPSISILSLFLLGEMRISD